MLSVKQGGIKYHFFSLWYDSTWDWTQVSRAIGEHFETQLTEYLRLAHTRVERFPLSQQLRSVHENL